MESMWLKARVATAVTASREAPLTTSPLSSFLGDAHGSSHLGEALPLSQEESEDESVAFPGVNGRG